MKNRRFQKWITVLLTGILLTSAIGCGSKEEKGQVSDAGEESQQQQDSDSQKEENNNEESGEVETFTVAMCQSTDIEDWDTNYLTQKLEKEMGVNIEFMMFPSDVQEAKTKLSLMVNSNEELPDIVLLCLGGAYQLSEIQEYGESGVFIPLNDYLADSSVTPNFNAIAEQHPEDMEAIKASITCANGNIYSFFSWYPEDWNFTPYRCYLNQSWLDKLGLEVPTTTDEFAAVLEAFATQDPNGNGIKDEIPLTGCAAGWGTDASYYLMNSFVFSDANMANNGLVLAEDGKTVTAPFVTEEWYKGLEYMRDLCERGLLDPAMFTMDYNALKALLDQETNVVGCVTSGSTNSWTNNLNNANFQEYVMIAPLKGPDGVAYAPAILNSAGAVYHITSSCKNPEMAARIGDWFLTEENSLTVRYGEEGVNWSTDEADVSTGTARFASEGDACKLKLLEDDVWGTVHNKMWNGAGPRYMNIDCYRGRDVSTADGSVSFEAQLHALSYKYYANAHPKLMPSLVYTSEENTAVSNIMVDVKDYVSNQTAAFITGNISMDEWDNYLKELDNMGLQTWIETAQTAYDRMTE